MGHFMKQCDNWPTAPHQNIHCIMYDTSKVNDLLQSELTQVTHHKQGYPGQLNAFVRHQQFLSEITHDGGDFMYKLLFF